MTREEHLLTIVSEEGAEITQRACKAARFGLAQIQQDADDKPEENPERLDNAERIRREFYDLVAVMRMAGLIALEERGSFHAVYVPSLAIERKQAKVERYLLRSERCGTLSAERKEP